MKVDVGGEDPEVHSALHHLLSLPFAEGCWY
jgi:hypothetical protein